MTSDDDVNIPESIKDADPDDIDHELLDDLLELECEETDCTQQPD